MLRDKANLALIAGIAIAICGILIYSLASPVKAQSAAINIVGKMSDTAVGIITFPQGAPGAIISNPYNSVDGTGGPQVLHASASEPVVKLKNTSGGTLFVTLAITGWTKAVVSERYELVATDNLTVNAVTRVLSADGNANTVVTSENITAGAYKALYLEVTLSAEYGKSGSSTLTILGQS